MRPYYQHAGITIYHGDCRELPLPDASVNCCVTSPPYWGLRDYGVDGQIGLEATPEEYVAHLVEIFREVRRLLQEDGTLWLNLGDSYANDTKWGGTTGGKHANGLHGEPIGRSKRVSGLKAKDLAGIPWRVAFALQADGWYLRSDIIWHKPNPMPESVTDRPTKAHEYLFLLAKSERYYYDAAAIAEPCVAESFRGSSFTRGKTFQARNDMKPVSAGARREPEARNKRSVWTVPTQSYPEAHFATFPEDLIKPCILAGCPAGGVTLDPFGGSGTTMQVARSLGCQGVMVELNADYCDLAAKRLSQQVLDLSEPIEHQFVSEASSSGCSTKKGVENL